MVGKEQTPGNEELSQGHNSSVGLPLRLLLEACWIQWRILTAPWQLLVFWISCFSDLLVRFLTAVGVPPVAYRDKVKLKEIQKVAEHLHQREDGFRRRITDMQGRIDARNREIKRLQRKLAQIQNESEETPFARTESVEDVDLDQKVQATSAAAKHIYFLVLGVLPMLWLMQQQSLPSISRKFCWSIFLPCQNGYYASSVTRNE